MKAVLSIVLCFCLMFVGCSTAWVSQATAIVGVLLPAAGNVLALVSAFSGNGIDANDLALVQQVGSELTGDLNKLADLINGYNALPADQKTTRLDEITAAIKLAQTHSSDFLAAAHIKNASLKTKVDAIIGLVVSELESVKALLPILQSGKMSAVRGMHRPLPAKELKRAVNATFSSPSGDASVDRIASGLVLK